MGLRLSASAIRLALLGFAFVLTSAVVAPFARCQTAHYSGVFVPIEVGFPFVAPTGVVADAAGNVWVVWYPNELQEFVAVNGIVPPNPTPNSWDLSNAAGFGGLPTSVAVDGAGNVFIVTNYQQGALTSSYLYEIQAVNGEVPANPTVTLLGSGSGGSLFAHVAVGPNGDVFLLGSNLYMISAVNGTIPANPTINFVAGFVEPKGLAVDASGNVLVSDVPGGVEELEEVVAVNGAIPASPTIRVLADGFNTGLWGSLAVDSAGNAYVASGPYVSNPGLREILAVDGPTPISNTANPTILSLNAGALYQPSIALDPRGNVVLIDSDCCGSATAYVEIQLPTVDFGAENVGGTGPSWYFDIPFVFDSPGTLGGWTVSPNQPGVNPGLDFAEISGGGSCSTAQSYNVGDTCTVRVQFSPQRAGLRTGAVQLFDPNGNVIATARLKGIGQGPQVVFPSNTAVNSVLNGSSFDFGVALDAAGNSYVSSGGGVLELMAVNGVIPTLPTIRALAGGYGNISVAVDAAGNVYFADSSTGAIYEIEAQNGAIPTNPTIRTLATGINTFEGAPVQIAVDAAGDVIYPDPSSGFVNEILAVGGIIPLNPTIRTVATGFSQPAAVAVDAQGNLFIADPGVSAVKEILAEDGAIPSAPAVVTLSGGFFNVFRIALDAAGDVLLANWNGYYGPKIEEILAVDGVIPQNPTVVVLASMGNPAIGVASDASGNVFFVQEANTGLSELSLATPPSVVFPTATAAGATDATDGPLSITIANDGNAPLVFPLPGGIGAAVSPRIIVANTTNPVVSSDFLWDPSSTCEQTTSSSPAPFSLAPGASCTIVIDFAPAAGSAGTVSGTVLLTDDNENAIGATQTIPLSGTAIVTSLTPPLMTPPGGTYSADQQVSISESAPGATIYYTTDGTTPTIHSAVFNSGSPIGVTANTTIKALAVESGLKNSAVATANYVLKVLEPTIGLAAGTYSTTQQASITDGTSNAAIWYTTDGMTPVPGASDATQYGGSPVAVPQSFDLKAVAAVTGWTTSTAASAKYTLKVAEPVIALAAGSYSTPQQASISDSNASATIWYTTDGMTPVPGASDATQYVSGNPVEISQSTTLKAVAAVTGWTTSTAASAKYTLKVPEPVISLATGSYSTAQQASISGSNAGAAIWYTTDGMTPVPGAGDATQYVGGNPVQISQTTTLKAVAAVSGWTTSVPASASYTFKVPTPTFSLAVGTYSSPQSTMISDADGGATIWYTTDGSTPVPGAADATQYGGGPIAINATTKLKAVAAESGWTTSAAAAASYTIK